MAMLDDHRELKVLLHLLLREYQKIYKKLKR